jgi:hypothetical protein
MCCGFFSAMRQSPAEFATHRCDCRLIDQDGASFLANESSHVPRLRRIRRTLPVAATTSAFPVCLDGYFNETSSMRNVVDSEKSVVQRNCSRIVWPL